MFSECGGKGCDFIKSSMDIACEWREEGDFVEYGVDSAIEQGGDSIFRELSIRGECDAIVKDDAERRFFICVINGKYFAVDIANGEGGVWGDGVDVSVIGQCEWGISGRDVSFHGCF